MTDSDTDSSWSLLGSLPVPVTWNNCTTGQKLPERRFYPIKCEEDTFSLSKSIHTLLTAQLTKDIQFNILAPELFFFNFSTPCI